MSLEISTRHWLNNEPTPLYDFSLPNTSYKSSSANIQSTTHIFLNKDNSIVLCDDNNTSQSFNYLFTIIFTNTHFFISTQDKHYSNTLNNNNNKHRIWLCVKFAYLYNTNYYNDKYGFKLTTGDVIRIGKVQFKIFTIHTSSNCGSSSNNNNNNVISNSNVTNCKNKYIVQINKPIGDISDKLLHTCRICFGDANEGTLINICKCTGSVKYIHIDCLYKWIGKHIEFKTYNYLSIYKYSPLQCEICKSEIPEHVKINKELIFLYNPIDIILSLNDDNKLKFKNCLILEHIPSHSNQQNNIQNDKQYFIINFIAKNEITLGRDSNVDVKMNDSSVSHFHAVLNLHEGNIYINDLSSKYGTHILLNTMLYDYPITRNSFIALQCGKTFVGLQVKNNVFTCCACLFKGKNKENVLTQQEMIDMYYNAVDKDKKQQEKEMMLKMKSVDIGKQDIDDEHNLHLKLIPSVSTDHIGGNDNSNMNTNPQRESHEHLVESDILTEGKRIRKRSSCDGSEVGHLRNNVHIYSENNIL